MDAHFRTDARRRGPGTGYISRDGKAMAGTVIDQNQIQQAAKWEGGSRGARLVRSSRTPSRVS